MDEIKTNIISFPKTINKEFQTQITLIENTVKELSNAMHIPCWDKVTVIPRDIKILAEFGETITFPSHTAARLITVLANQIIKLELEKEDIDLWL